MSSRPILVVDDEAPLRELLRLYLQKEFYVLEAAEGREALSILKEQNPALVLLDVLMPSLDGWETLRQIREESPVPVVMLTASGGSTDREYGLQLGADDFITKPIDGRDLVDRVHAVLRRANPPDRTTDRVEIGGLVLWPMSRLAEWHGRPLDLPPKTFDLLQLLAANAGQVLSRERLFRRVWGSDSTENIRTVDCHIKDLRRKLGDDGTLIATVWGKGYRYMNLLP